VIDLYYWPTPNGWKISIMLEECAIPYNVKYVNIGAGEQFNPDFVKISPNNRMPAIIDHEPMGGGAPISIFESGAILEYLAEKTGKFMPREPGGKYEVLQWVYWQVGGLGPMAGQNHHFSVYAPEKLPYAINRYVKETNRLYGVIERRLRDRPFLAGDYSVADMAAFPWIVPHKLQGQKLEDFPKLKAWFEAIHSRPAVIRGLDLGKEKRGQTMSDEAKKVLFGQTAANVLGH
jgi:GSH-dependent disulfide-bond oxidoreductase